MTREFASEPRRVVAAIGPAIGRCCYEVGPEVLFHFGKLFPEWDNLNDPPEQHRHLDLVEANRRLLVQAGLSPENIDTATLCTACEGSLFDSYRREREASGRMLSAISLSEADRR